MVAEALRSRPVLAGIAKVVQSSAQRHIAEGAGREGQFKPLKLLFGRWQDKKGVWHEQAGYRNGGQPLRDTGNLMRSLRGHAAATDGGMEITITGAQYGAYQERGFTTKGPNLIPLTRKGVRSIGAGNAFLKAKKGKDYIIARNGVTVPARPYLMPTKDDMKELGLSIVAGLRIALKGK